MNWTLIRSFLAVVESGTLCAAANALKASQPTLSRHIRQLEEDLGYSLFDHRGHALELNDRGAALIETARRMQAAAADFELAAAGRVESASGTVRITASQVVAHFLMPAVLAEFQKIHPDIQIELVPCNETRNISRREADIALRMFEPMQNDLVRRKIGEITLGVYVSDAYEKAHGLPNSLEELVSNHRMIGYDESRLIIDGFEQFGVALTREHFSMRTDDQIAYTQLVVKGCGVGFISDISGKQLGLVPILGGPPISALPIWLTTHEELRKVPSIRTVMDFLAAEIPATLQHLRYSS